MDQACSSVTPYVTVQRAEKGAVTFCMDATERVTVQQTIEVTEDEMNVVLLQLQSSISALLTSDINTAGPSSDCAIQVNTNQDWSHWNPKTLKTPKHKLLQKGTKISSINELAETKIALSKMQLQLTEAEMQFKTEEHQLRINALQNEYVLKQKCLEMDLEIKIKQCDIQAAILEGLELDNNKKRLELQKV